MHMNAVIEINEIRQIVNARPFQRTIFAKTCTHRLERRTVTPHLRVAVHAGFRRRNPGEGAFFDRSMAIPTIDADAGYMMLMAERHRLLAHDVSFSEVRRSDENTHDSTRCGNDEDRTENAQSRKRIGTAVEILCHDELRPLLRWHVGFRFGEGC
jgi:hypothetical protein